MSIATFFSVALLLQSLTVTVSNNAPSPARYFEPAAQRNFALSPSGRYLAYVQTIPLDEIDYDALPAEEDSNRIQLSSVNMGIGDQIQIHDFETGAVIRSISIPKEAVYTLHWATEARLLASVSETYDLNIGSRYVFELPSARTLSFTPFSNEEPVALFANNKIALRQNLNLSDIVDPLPNDPNSVLMSAYRYGDLDLWRVNIINGDAERIATGTPRTFGWVSDGRGEAAFRLDQNANGGLMSVYARTENNRWRFVTSSRFNETGGGQDFWPIARGSNDNEIYVLTKPAGGERTVIAVYDLNNGAISAPVLEDDTFDFAGGLVDPHTRRFFGAWLLDDRYRAVFLDESLQRHLDGVNAFFDKKANVRVVTASRDFRRLILEVSGPRMPGDIYSYDLVNRRIEPMFNTRPELGGRNLSPVEILTVKARDGTPLRAYVTHPAAIGDRRAAPLIVLPHGGPASRDSYSFDPKAQFLASRGYRVLQVNFRGSAGYGASFERAGHREWGGKMHEDLMDAYAAVKSRGLTGDFKTCIVGASYGGYAALYAALAEPDTFDCAVSIAGVTDLPDIIKSERSNGDAAYEQAREQIGDLRADNAMLIRKSPARRASEFKIPLLLIHGRYDQIVPYDQFLKMTRALDKAEIEYDWFVLQDDHYLSFGSWTRSMRRIEDFLDKNMKP